MVERKPNPKILAVWAIAGAFFAASSYLLVLLPIPRLPGNGHGFWALLWMNRLRFVTFFGPFFLGLAISLGADRRFKRGFHDDLWSEAELEPVKVFVAYPIWTWASLALIVPGLLTTIFSRHTPHSGGSIFFYAALLPSQIAQGLRQLIMPRVKTTGVFKDWQNFKPIHSDHWGKQPFYPSE
jgi:hypothetical protein